MRIQNKRKKRKVALLEGTCAALEFSCDKPAGLCEVTDATSVKLTLQLDSDKSPRFLCHSSKLKVGYDKTFTLQHENHYIKINFIKKNN